MFFDMFWRLSDFPMTCAGEFAAAGAAGGGVATTRLDSELREVYDM